MFRIDSKSWFLTYPKLDLTKEEAMTLLKVKLASKPWEGIVVCRELHQDGSPHIHAYVALKNRFNCTNARFWDLNGQHGDYQAARNIDAVSKYIKKDGDYKEEGNIIWSQKVSARESHTKALYRRLVDGEPLHEVTKEEPTLLANYLKLKQNIAAFKADCALDLPLVEGFIPNTLGVILPVLQDKRRHYWLWSAGPNKGKTTFLKCLSKNYPCFWYSWQEKFQNYTAPRQFILIDEYSTGHLTVTCLNMICDGTYQYPVKGSDSFTLPDSIVIICGNRNPLHIYYDPRHAPLLEARFNIICLDTK